MLVNCGITLIACVPLLLVTFAALASARIGARSSLALGRPVGLADSLARMIVLFESGLSVGCEAEMPARRAASRVSGR
jgi:hypothetical protein